MSEGIQGKKGRQQRRAKSTEDSYDAPPREGWTRTEKGAAEETATRVAAVLAKSLFAVGTRNRTVSPVLGLNPDVRFYAKSLVNSLTTKNLDATLAEIDRIVAAGRGSIGLDCEVLFWSHLICSVIDNTSAGKSVGSSRKARRLAFKRQLDSFCQESSVDRLATVINSSLVIAAENSNQSLTGLVEFLIGGSDVGPTLLEKATELSTHQKIALAAATCLGGLPSEQKTLILVRELELALSDSKEDTVLSLPPNLFQTVLCVLETQTSFLKKSGYTQLRAGLIANKLKAMATYNDAGESSTAAAAWAVASRLSPAGADGGIGVTNILADLGPACTNNVSTLRDTLREITNIRATNGGGSSSSLDEAAIARLIIFFAERGTRKRPKDGGDPAGSESNSMSPVLVGALTNDSSASQGDDSGKWNLDTVSQVISEDYASLDWNAVAGSFDLPGLAIRDDEHLVAILRLFRSGAKSGLPLAPIVSSWKNYSSQVALLERLLFVPSSVYTFQVNDAEAADAATVLSDGNPLTSANPQGWASAAVLQRLLHLSDAPEVAERVKAIFRGGITHCPDVLLCALLRIQLNITSVATQQSGFDDSVGKRLKGDIMRSLLPTFFRPNQIGSKNAPATLRRLWSISPETVVAFCIEAWRDTREEPPRNRLATVQHVINIIRQLPSPENATASILNNNKDLEFSLTVAFVMADNGMLQLRQWFSERVSGSGGGGTFAMSLIAYIGRMHTTASARSSDNKSNDEGPPLVSIENIATSLQYLKSLNNALLSQQLPNPASSATDNVSTPLTVGDSVKALTEACVSAHPSLESVLKDGALSGGDGGGTVGTAPTSGNSDDIEEMANSYFQKIYTSEQSIGEVVEMLKRFKTSGDSRENDIFACMIHNLFDEYRFFSKYPEKELRITGILFGMLIQHQLVSSITLGIALRYVLEALRKTPSHPAPTNSNSGKMFRFGMFALEQFKGRLHEWPQYCSHIVQIPHLREKYADLVMEIEDTMADTKSRDTSASVGGPAGTRGGSGEGGSATGTSSDPGSSAMISEDGISDAKKRNITNSSTQVIENNEAQKQYPTISLGTVGTAGNQKALQNRGFAPNQAPTSIELTPPALALNIKQQQFQQQPPARVAVFGPGLGRAVNQKVDSAESLYETPPDAILDRIQFLINNLCASNVEQKSQEIKEMLTPKYFGWLGHYLVVKRISTQPNFHSLYLNFLDQMGDFGKGLVEAILSSVYLNVGKLLRSSKITISTSERSLLKNLGSWLGQITLARNRPILQIMLDCKELLFQGYETGRLIAVTPFVAKILEGAKNSVVFRPPNPWLMGLLSVFRALYGVDDLKMNIKFEVEVLCKNLGVKLEEIPRRTNDLGKRISPNKERNPDFNMKSSMMGQTSGSGTSGSGSSAATSMSAAATAVSSSGAAVASLSSVLTSPEGKQGSAGLGSTAAAGLTIPSTPSADVSKVGSGNASATQDQQQTVIPNLAAYVTINASIPQIFQQLHNSSLSTDITAAALKRAVPVAVDRAIREIIQPVVERSVTIACITTKEIVTKDFAMESDENKMRKAAQLMVANLAGSLALVTCREPLRASVSTHLRQLLASSSVSSGGSGSNSSSNLTDQEQSTLEQCVIICATDNLELGCMLIEKAATEKAVRDMDEALAPALNARKKHREQTGQPFYDMSIFGSSNQRYPGALPDPLRPKPGGLRPEQLLVYEAFQRMPRQPVVPASQQQTTTSGVGDANGRPGSLPTQSSGSGVGANAVIKGDSGGQRVNIEALSSIARKLDSSVSSLLSASGPRAPEITLAMLPNDHEIRQLLLVVHRVMPTASSNSGISMPVALNSTETDAILGFAQGIFKRMYELSLSELLRLEAMVALLEALNETCSQLGKDLGTWATYAPAKTDAERKLHRTVLLLLVRSHLISVSELDVYLARSMEGGQNPIWVEFTLLFVQTAVLERIAVPSELPKVMEVLTKIGDGRVQINQQVSQNYRKPVLRLLEKLSKPSEGAEQQAIESSTDVGVADVGSRSHPTHQQSSSISAVSLNNLAEATKRAAEATENTMRNDPPNMKQQVTFLLDSWMRIQGEAVSNEKALAQYLQLLQQNGVGKVEEQTERFLRLSTDVVVEACIKSAVAGEVASSADPDPETGGKVLNYSVIDSYAKLASLLVRYMNGGGSPEQVANQRLTLLNKVLGVTVRTMMANYERNKQEAGSNFANWDQRPWFRLLLNLVHELNSPSPTLDPISLGILSVFGSAFHVVQPLVIPAFAFAWLELISHRMFLSNLLLIKGQKGWGVAHQLLIDLFLFLEPHLRKTELTDAIKQLYKGTLRVLLVLLHDFPSFLAGYHLSFCNVIPENCVQLRNLILSAFPRGMVLPDPFPRNFKIDLLPEITQSPVVLSNVAGPLGSIKSDLDAHLKGLQPSEFVSGLLPRLYKDGANDIDAPRVSSLVLYVGIQGLARLQNSQIAHTLAHTPEMEVLQKLMDFDDRGRYISLNAIANQLRYPSSHTHYFSCVMLFLFEEAKDDAIKEQITRVLLERLIVHRPHPWGLLITFIELIKNQKYQFWSHPFTRCATEIEKVFESVARSCMTPASLRAVTSGGSDDPQ